MMDVHRPLVIRGDTCVTACGKRVSTMVTSTKRARINCPKCRSQTPRQDRKVNVEKVFAS